MFFKLFLIVLSSFIFSCNGWRIGETSEGASPYNLAASVTEECRAVEYTQTFVSYFNQEVFAVSEDLKHQEEQIDKAFSCVEETLTQITSEIRGEQTDSLSKSELRALLSDPSIQKLFKDKGFKNVEVFINNLQDPGYFDRFVEIKNFVIDVISHFSSDLSSEKVCGGKRDRFYKWEVKVFIAFLDIFKDWMKDVNIISEIVYSHLIENILLETGSNATYSYFGPFYSEGKYKVRKSFFSNLDHSVKYFRPALSKGFVNQSPNLAVYFSNPLPLPSESFLSQVSWDYFSLQSQQARQQKAQARQFAQAVSIIIENNKVNKSGFLTKSDIQFLVMNASIANALFNAYDSDQDFQVTREEFYKGTSCLEDFLLPLFKDNKEAFHYFIEFQKSLKEKKNLPEFWFDQLVGDEGFSLSRDDVFKLSAVLFSAFFPYSLIEKDAKIDKKNLLLALKQLEKQSSKSKQVETSSPND